MTHLVSVEKIWHGRAHEETFNFVFNTIKVSLTQKVPGPLLSPPAPIYEGANTPLSRWCPFNWQWTWRCTTLDECTTFGGDKVSVENIPILPWFVSNCQWTNQCPVPGPQHVINSCSKSQQHHRGNSCNNNHKLPCWQIFEIFWILSFQWNCTSLPSYRSGVKVPVKEIWLK